MGVRHVAVSGDEEGRIAGVDHREEGVETDAGEWVILYDAQSSFPYLYPSGPTGIACQSLQVGNPKDRLSYLLGTIVGDPPGSQE